MQILIHGALVDQRDGRRRQGFLRLDPLRYVSKLLGIFLNKILFLFQKNESKINRHGKVKIITHREWNGDRDVWLGQVRLRMTCLGK